MALSWRKILFSLFFYYCSIVGAKSETVEDIALYRVGAELFFYSDLFILSEDVKSFRCLLNDQVLLNLTDEAVPWEKIRQLPRLWNEGSKKGSFLTDQSIDSSLLELLQILYFTRLQGQVDIKDHILEVKARMKKCQILEEDLLGKRRFLTALFRAEKVLKERFDKSNEKLKDSKLRDSFNNYVRTIFRQVDAQRIWEEDDLQAHSPSAK